MEPMLVRFTKEQRAFIRREKRRMKLRSEAEVVRHYIDGYRLPTDDIYRDHIA